MELDEEMSPGDVVLLLAAAPERISDLCYWLDEAQLRYRHGPAFPTLGNVIAHLVESSARVEGMLRRVHLDGETTADVRATLDPSHDQELTRPLHEALEDFARVRRRTIDLVHGWGAGQWERRVSDPRAGDLTLLQVCRTVARHETGHISQIRNLSALLPESQDLGPAGTRSNGE